MDKLHFTPENLSLSDENFVKLISTPEYDFDQLSQPCYPNEEVLSKLAGLTYEDPPSGWIRLTSAYNEKDDYFGSAYYNSSCNQLVIAHIGFRNHESFANDIGHVYSNSYISQISSAVTFSLLLLSKIEERDKKVHLSFTGYSLNGWLAQITTFAVKYLSDLLENENLESYHAHTVVFDSPGCYEMLTQICQDYCCQEKPDEMIKSLDITVYLSTVNLVNSCNTHIGSVFKIYPKDILLIELCKDPKKLFSLQQSQKIQQFVEFFDNKTLENCNIKEVVNWDLFTLPEQTSFNYFSLVQNLFQLNDNDIFEIGSEYKIFLDFDVKTKDYDSNLAEEEIFEYGAIKFLYKVVPRKWNCRKISAFSSQELKFLEYWRDFRKEGVNSTELHSFFNVKNYLELLPNFDINDEVIHCDSKRNLDLTVNFTKQLFLYRPEIYDAIKREIPKYPKIFEPKYHDKAKAYKLELENIFETCVGFKDTIELRTFLESKKNILYLFTENTKMESFRIYQLLKTMKKNDFVILNWVQLMEIHNYVEATKIFKSILSKIDSLLVIEYDDINAENMELIRKFSRIQSKTKKLVFIVKNTYKKVFWEYNDKNKKETSLSFKDLDDNSQKLFLKRKFMKLRNQKINLEQLLGIKMFDNLSDEQLEILEDIFNFQIVLHVINNDNYVINLTDDNQLHIESEISFVEMYRDIESICLKQFLQQEKMTVNQKNMILYIGGLKTKNIIDELLNYLSTEDENLKSVIEKLIEDKKIILTRGENHFSDYKELCNQCPDKVIYWMELNYDKNNTIKMLKVFDSDLYIDRKFHNKRIIHKNNMIKILESLSETSLLILCDVKNVDEFQNQFMNLEKKSVIFAQSEDEANELFQKNVAVYKSIHLFAIKEDENIFEWKKFSGSYNEVYHLSCLDVKSFFNEDDFIKDDQKIKIISDDFCMGKSTVLHKYATSMKSSLIVHINVKDIEYADIPEKNDSKDLLEEIFKFLMTKTSNCESGLFAKLFKKGLQTKECLRVFIFIDGFNEIKNNEHLESFQNKIVYLLKYLSRTTTAKIIVTTRKSLREKLETELSIFAAEFQKITDNDQLQYLKKLWLSQIFIKLNSNNEVYDKKVEAYIIEILKNINSAISEEISEAIGIFFQIKMLTLILGSSVNILETSMKLMKKKINNSFDFFGEYFKKKMDMYFSQEKWQNFTSDIKDSLIKHYYNHHIFLSFRVIFPKEVIELKNNYSLSDEIKGKINRIGIFRIHNDGKIEVIHKILVDYFVAYKLADWIRHGGDIFKSNNALVLNIFLDKKYKIIRKFLDDSTLQCNDIKYFSNNFRKLWDTKRNQFLNENNETIFHVLISERCSKALLQFFIEVINHAGLLYQIFSIRNMLGNTALHLATVNGLNDIVQTAIKAGANVNEKSSFDNTPFHKAAKMSNDDIVQTLINAGAKVNEKHSPKYTSLHLAAQIGHNDVVQTLIEAGANVNEKDTNKHTPLHLAVLRGHSDIVQTLINAGANVNEKSLYNLTPLHEAAQKGRNDIVQTLINAGANVNQKDSTDDTPLLNAAKMGHNDIVQTLINAGAKVNEKHSPKYTSLHLAAQIGHNDVVQTLIKAGANVNKKGLFIGTPLHLAAKNGNNDVVQTLINAGANVNEKDSTNETPLHNAAEYGHHNIVETLIKAGANVNVKGLPNWTPLHKAAQNGRKDIVQTLINVGANVNEKDLNNNTPLHYAVRYGYNGITQILIQAGANVNEKDSNKDTPLHCAARYGYNGIAQTLIKAGANVNEKGPYNHAPLHAAAKNGRNDIVQALINAGANVNEKDSNEDTPLHCAARYGYNGIAQTLIKAGANVNEKGQYNYAPLDCAAENGHNDIVQILINGEANVNQKTLNSSTPLHKAAKNGHNDIVQTLINGGANVNEKEETKSTPLHYAAEMGHNDTVQILIKSGANINEGTLNSHTPLHLAAVNGYNDVVRTLIKAGANLLTSPIITHHFIEQLNI